MLFQYRLQSQARFAHTSGPNQRKQAHILSMQYLPDGHQFAFSTNQRSRFYAKFLHDRFIALFQRFVLARSAFALALQNTIIIEDKVSWFQMISKRSVCTDLERSHELSSHREIAQIEELDNNLLPGSSTSRPHLQVAGDLFEARNGHR